MSLSPVHVTPTLPPADEIDALLRPLAPMLAEEADAILDLRDLLMRQGHAGKCVKCFFQLFTTAGSRQVPALEPLSRWIESHFEIAVEADGREMERLPVTLKPGEDLEAFCRRSIRGIRMDRHFKARKVSLAFRYKAAA